MSSPTHFAIRLLPAGHRREASWISSCKSSPCQPRKKPTLAAPALTPGRARECSVNSDSSVPACPICLEPYGLGENSRKPKCLPYCGHVLCEACLDRLLSGSGNHIVCHICKAQNSLLTHKSAAEFPYSWPLMEQLERQQQSETSLTTSASSKSAGQRCGHCTTREASHWCAHHAVKLCAYCAFAHGKECRADKLVAISDLEKFTRTARDRQQETVKVLQDAVGSAVAVRERWAKEISPKLDAMVEEIQNVKKSAAIRLDLHIMQLRALLAEVQAADCPEEPDLIQTPKDDDLLRPYIKKMSALDDFVKSRANLFQKSYKLSISFFDDAYSVATALVKRSLAVEAVSPYLPTAATTLAEALHQACNESGREEIVDFLLTQAKLGVNTRDKCGMTPFSTCVSRRDQRMYRKLREQYGADVNVQDNAGKCALIYACMNGDEEAVRYLVSKCRANANVVCKWKDTPLHCAVEAGSLGIVKLLIQEGKAKINTPNGRGKLAKDLTRDPEMRKYLLSIAV